MALDTKRREQLAHKASDAESLLVLTRFREAEKTSLELLQSTAYLPGSQSEQQRAAYVYIQAMYEENR